jgi:hypothetical protein
VQHLPGDTQGFCRCGNGQTNHRQNIFLKNFAGMNRGSRFFLAISSSAFLMVIFQIDVYRLLARPPKRDSKACRHAHRPPLWTAVQTMKPKSCDVHVFRLLRDFKQLQNSDALPDLIRPDAACPAVGIKLLESFVFCNSASVCRFA